MPPARKRSRTVHFRCDSYIHLTTVRVSPGKGLGLFATGDIPKHQMVAQMRQPGRMKRNEWEIYMTTNPCLPHDAAIYIERSPLIFYDQSWSGKSDNIPLWYRLNHSASPNTAMAILDRTKPARQQEIAWLTLRNINKGEELTFEYTDVPDCWH